MKIFYFICLMFWSSVLYSIQITVDSTEFDASSNGNCNLAEAVLSAGLDFAFDQCLAGNGNDEIVFEGFLFNNVLNTMFVNLDDTMLVFGDSIDIKVPFGKTLSLNSDGNQSIFIVNLNLNKSFGLNNSILKNASSTENGGAIQFNEKVDDITLSNIQFINNSSDLNGGAIGFKRDVASTNVTTLTIEMSQFEGNNAEAGGAVFADKFVKVIISNNDYVNNVSADTGGAIWSKDDLSIDTTNFNGNMSQYGAGVFSAAGNTSIISSVFEDNQAVSIGGAVYKSNFANITATDFEFRRNSVLNNTAGNAAGLYIKNSNTFMINNLIANNIASQGVGGLHVDLSESQDGLHQVRLIGNSLYHNISQAGGYADILTYFSSGVSTYMGNLIVSTTIMNSPNLCEFIRSSNVNSNYNLTNESMDCLLGANNQVLTDPIVSFENVVGFHPNKLVPQITSPLIDAWPRSVCNDHENTLLDFDLNGRRNVDGLFNIFDGNADGIGDCDIGSAEIPRAVLVAVGQVGTGFGRIFGNPETAIDCPGPAICEQAIVIGEQVVFETEAYSSSQFVKWGLDGIGCGTDLTCPITVPDHNITISAEFEALPTFTLEVVKIGTGDGLIFSSPTLFISCGPTCINDIPENEVITLNVSVNNDNVFLGWFGACTGTGVCNITMNQNQQVTARFELSDVIFNNGFEEFN